MLPSTCTRLLLQVAWAWWATSDSASAARRRGGRPSRRTRAWRWTRQGGPSGRDQVPWLPRRSPRGLGREVWATSWHGGVRGRRWWCGFPYHGVQLIDRSAVPPGRFSLEQRHRDCGAARPQGRPLRRGNLPGEGRRETARRTRTLSGAPFSSPRLEGKELLVIDEHGILASDTWDREAGRCPRGR